MFLKKPLAHSFYLVLAAAALILSTPYAHAWGNDGHRLINRLAASNLPADVPDFLRSPVAIDEIEYLGPEPGPVALARRAGASRCPGPPSISLISNSPMPSARSPIAASTSMPRPTPPVRKPDTIGLQPWQTEEVWERLKAAMREYRAETAAHQDTKPVEAAILFYAGWLGHYVGDGSQPLHVTVQYNGWTGPNPNGYTTSHQIHTQFESTFVSANLAALDVKSKLTTARRPSTETCSTPT